MATYTVGNVQAKVAQLTGNKPRDMIVRRTARDLFKDPDSTIQMSHVYSETQFKALILALARGTGSRQPASASDYAESQARKLIAKYSPKEAPAEVAPHNQKPAIPAVRPATAPQPGKVTDSKPTA